MKNIFIIGVPRSGKTTLAKLIKDKYPLYNLFSFEALRNAFIESQPELGMENRNSLARKNILPKHFVTFASWNKEIYSIPSLVEGDFCSINELYDLINDDIIICLGLGCRPLKDIINGIRENDNENDYTKDMSDEQLNKHFHDILEKDKYNYDFCLKNNIRYYDTYNNRVDIFNKILDDIKELIR